MKRRIGFAGALVAAAVATAACGGESGSGVATLGGERARQARSAATVDPEEAQLAFAECMREHGIDVPDPGTDLAGGDRAVAIEIEEELDESQFREADEACRHHLEGVFDEPSEQDLREMEDAALKFAQCMRANGVEDHPDPKFERGGMTLEIAGDGVTEDPDFEEAEEKCREMLPGLGSGGVERVGQ